MSKGDHLFTDHISYDHHGIDCGDGTVIHFSSKRGGEIVRFSKSQFSEGKKIHLKRYQKKFSPNAIVERAKSQLGSNKYNLITNNCEHFCYYCTTGEHTSYQVNNTAAAGAAAAGAFGAAAFGLAALTTEVSAGGIMGLLGATTTVALIPPVGGAAIAAIAAGAAGVAAHQVLKKIDNQDGSL